MDMAFGGIKSPYDYRTIQADALIGQGAPLPDKFFVDVTKLPVWYQRAIGACTAHAAAKKKQQMNFKLSGGIVVDFSARWPYILSKNDDGLPQTQGTYYYMPLKEMYNWGICTEKLLPNDTTLPYEQYVDINVLTPAMYEEAAQYKIPGYASVKLDEDSLKQSIIAFDGVILGLQLGNEWWTPSWNAKDILPLKVPVIVVSGHALYLYGWDTVNGKTRFWIFNSWSKDWAENGLGYFFYDEYRASFSEAWSVANVPDKWIQQLKQLPSEDKFSHSFDRDIVFDEQSDEVKALQTALMIDGEFSSKLYHKLLDSNGLGYYGEITQNAVKAFQVKYQVASKWELLFVNGKRVGPKTRIKLNQLFKK